MLPPKTSLPADEELGKKDDDHRPGTSRGRYWQPKQWAPRRRRVLFAIVGIYLIYLFFRNMPTDLMPAPERYNPAIAIARQRPWAPSPSPAIPPQDAPTRDEAGTKEDTKNLDYGGELRFYALGKTLERFQRASNRKGHVASQAVVFAGSSLRSVSDILPLACQMARQSLNDVHFVLMGRDDVSVEGIKQVNGIHDLDCPVIWHDGRPDNSQSSTEVRMENAAAVGLGYVESAIRPRVIITQGKAWEDAFFLRGVERKTKEAGTTHIELPSAAGDLTWISMLDSSALEVWNDVGVEFLIHAPPGSSGSLIRLIRSLENANYLGSTPSLTIELPSRVDPQLLGFLQSMKFSSHIWSKVSIRRRIQPHDLNPVESSIKTVEAFYPLSLNTSHLLVLSPQAEVAPSFYHYLKYTLLNYKYSDSSKQLASKLLGISLELPSSKPTTDNEPFIPPIASEGESERVDSKPLSHFLWQAPNSNAALYFGDRWAELHSFLSKRFAVKEASKDTAPKEKLVSKKYPAVMEHVLEMTRAKGYYMLYPSYPAQGGLSLAMVHNDLYQFPEEFAQHPDPEASVESAEKPLNRMSTLIPLLDQFSSNLPELDTLPILSHHGDLMSEMMLTQDTAEYARKFRLLYGGCPEGSTHETNSEDLFCVGDQFSIGNLYAFLE